MKSTDKNMSNYEKEILEDFEKGAFVPVENEALEIKKARETATYYLKKNSRINIRMPEADLNSIKSLAREEGMPYQTLIASILHKFVTGKLIQANLRGN